MKGFRAFINRGNLISLAIAIVIGTAFTAMVTALVADLITPLIAAVAGKPNFGDLQFTIHRSTFLYGLFLNAVLSFLIIAAVVYYLIVTPSGAADRAADEESGSDDQGLPGVPEHHSDRGVAVHVLHGPTPAAKSPPPRRRLRPGIARRPTHQRHRAQQFQ